jgi:hypothetical protein
MHSDDDGCELAQQGVRHAIQQMGASRIRLAHAIARLKAVDEATRMTTDVVNMTPGMTAPAEGNWFQGTTDTTLLQAALEEAGRINAAQAKMLDDQRKALELTAETMYRQQGEIGDWAQRYTSVANRLAENWPTDPQVAQMKSQLAQMNAWLTDLKGTLAAALADAAESREDARVWRERFYGSYNPSAPNYAEGPVEPVAPGPAKDTDEEMLG